MKYIFSLEEQDYLTHQLFVVSTSKPVVWRRRRSWMLTTGTFFIIAWLFYENYNDVLTNYFLIVGIASLFLFPFYSRWRYRNHYRRHVKENLKNSIGKKVTVEFQEDHIASEDEFSSESKISNSLISSLHELPDHFLIRLNNAQSLILPKKRIQQLTELRSDITNLSSKLQIELTDNTSWKWR